MNGRLTVEIAFLGVSFATLVYAFAWKFMGLTLEKEKIFWKHFVWGIQYLAVLLKEIVVANITVLKIVLSPKKKVHPMIVSFDAPLKKHILQVILADSITLTPGTITVRLYEEKFEYLGNNKFSTPIVTKEITRSSHGIEIEENANFKISVTNYSEHDVEMDLVDTVK